MANLIRCLYKTEPMRNLLIKTISLIMVAFVSLSYAMASSPEDVAKDGVKSVKEYVAKLGRYHVKFNVLAGDLIYVGEYGVEGDSYYIQMDNVEVYSDGKLRYEVDNKRKEVSIDMVDLQSRNILDNPTRCFDFAESEYEVELQSDRGEELMLYLQPIAEDMDGEIFLTIDKKSGRPKKIVYRLYDDEVEVAIDSIAASKSPIKRYNKNHYMGYDIIDFR